ncbi:c-type cytochrome [Parasulfuritortus cantonensis]|uniref:C-type cytochrome n=1 Tax=Parasulfuritortus cantonensis TaxID=2528202 RepID=A0A4R1BC94_9PROT|nr:c-type cytochrome [Parasulfuritortus cantonensis]TCJ14659.1 c-type cytochrome [Parasulfuritortus cantonensis]
MTRPLLATLLFGLALAAPPLDAAGPAAAERDAALAMAGDPVKGKAAYRVCRGCHQADGAGRADAGYPQLAGQQATVLVKQMADVRSGRRQSPAMHPFINPDEVSTRDLADIAAYLAGLPVPAGNGKGDGRHLARGRTLYERDCATCHGRAGEGDGARFVPRLAGQHYRYLVRESTAIRAQAGARRDADADMVRAIAPYTAGDIAAVSDYLARFRSAR